MISHILIKYWSDYSKVAISSKTYGDFGSLWRFLEKILSFFFLLLFHNVAFLHLEKEEGLVNLKLPFSSKTKMHKMQIHKVVLAYSSAIIIKSCQLSD